jgi:tyrosine-protein kinase Etk/Wzc
MVDLGAVAVKLLVEWRRWLVWSTIFFAVGALFILHVPAVYEAQALLLPKETDKTLTVERLGAPPGVSSFVGLLESRTVLDFIVDQVHLLDVYKTHSREIARELVRASSVILGDDNGMVAIKVRNRDPRLAADIANAYIDGLEALQGRSAVHDAELRSRFFRQQVTEESDALAAAEQDLEDVEQKTGVIEPSQQTQSGLNAIAAVRTEITGLQVQLSSLLLAETDQNPQVRQIRAQIGALEAKERSLETSGADNGAGASPVAAKMPQVNLDYARKQRAVKYHETLLDSLAAQYQTARLGENYNNAEFEIVDRATVPEFRVRRPRALLLILDAAASALLGLFAIVFTLAWRKLMADPIQRERMATVKASFRRRG